MNEASQVWICAQLGAREHYAVPRMLHSRGALEWLFTDAWVWPESLLGRFRRSWRERYHPVLATNPVASANASLLQFELTARLRGLHGWHRIMARNQWFQRQALRQLFALARHSRLSSPSFHPILFAYSYAALDLFRFAKTRGWRTVLGQIDPGPREEVIVAKEAARRPDLDTAWERPPARYWELWREECALADRIVVNSEWSQRLLVEAGIEAERIRVVPLAYEPPAGGNVFQRSYPAHFTLERPLRVLFLGQINLRKGMASVLEAVDMLADAPVEFSFVGALGMKIPERHLKNRRLRWCGQVPRSEAAKFYREADVFLFPTLSDGFGLTQLEAQAWRLPVVASRNCGEVIHHNENGWLLAEVTGNQIAKALRVCLQDPLRLQKWSNHSGVEEQFSLASVGRQLVNLVRKTENNE